MVDQVSTTREIIPMDILVTIFLLMVQSALATLVIIRAHDYQPGRFFVALIFVFATLNAERILSRVFSDPAQIYIVRSIFTCNLGLFSLTLLWLLSQLFMPQWWQGRRAIIWISMPYVLAIIVLTIDLIGRFGWFVAGLNPNTGTTFLTAEPGSLLLIRFFTLGWLVHVALLIVAFIQHRHARQPIAWLVFSIVLTIVVTQINIRIKIIPPELTGLVVSVPILIALSYVVLQTSLLVPTRAALDLALRSLADIVVVLDRNEKIAYVNKQATHVGFQLGQLFAQELVHISSDPQVTGELFQAIKQSKHSDIRLSIGEQQLIFTSAPVVDARERQRGTLLIGRDVTQLEQRTAELEQRSTEQQHLLDLVATLEAPTIILAEGVLFAPIIGYVDSRRAQALMARLLNAAHTRRTRAVILDITGLQVMDSSVTELLVQTTVALRLLGCQVLISGISASMAATFVQQGNLLADIPTVHSPQEALQLINS